MGNTIIFIATALISGLMGALITIWWQEKSNKKRKRVEIFEILMSKRYEISSEESVDALNRVDAIFYNSENIRHALKEFKKEASSQEVKVELIYDKYLKLLELIAENIGYKKIRWDDMKDYYYPVGLSTRKQDEIILRRAQIDAALLQIKNSNEDKNISQTNKQDELSNKLIVEAMENPDKILNLMKIVEQAQKLNR